MKHKSIKIKILLYFGLVSFILFTIFTISFYILLKQKNISNIKNELYTQASKIENSENYQNRKFKYPFLIVKNNKVIYKFGKFEIKDKILLTRIKNKKNFFALHTNGHEDVFYALKDDNRYILIAKNNFDDNMESFISILIFLEVLLLILFIFLANNILNKILNPIKQINKTVRKININNLNSYINFSNNGKEIDELVDNFNNMIERLKNGIERIEKFNSDVSHELKTPLTVIDMSIELALKKERNIEYYKNTLKTLQTEIQKIETIINELLLITKYDKYSVKKTFSICDFNSILLDVIEKYASTAQRKNINIELLKFEKIEKETNCFLIKTIFKNIIDNAVKYTPSGKNIYISLYLKNKKVYFIVKDEGIGIPGDKIDKITERFYRTDESRNKKIEGYGLGLSIVKNFLNLIDGNLQIVSQLNKGTIVTVIL
ncbi:MULTISPECIES: sensor histidine kinase [unclassified Lebetimonas]|uniref:sensor histidine kinase n=1 Tax=unclassified Lebetimonas TaxID=2648158 RepID=UPI0004670C88|nr:MULTISPECIES: HAMP domain-containing sensor histidine kinase [unclassified Lebetimonas]